MVLSVASQNGETANQQELPFRIAGELRADYDPAARLSGNIGAKKFRKRSSGVKQGWISMQQQGWLSTLMLVLPMLAVPVLAITGIPQFSSSGTSRAVAEGENGEMTSDELERLLSGEVAAPSDAPLVDKKKPGKASSRPQADGADVDWASGDSSVRGAKPGRTVSGESWGLPPAQNGEPESGGATPVGFTDRSSNRGVASAANGDESAAQQGYRRQVPSSVPNEADEKVQLPPISWQQAVHRLNELGVQNFRLEPSRIAGQYVFVCWYTPRDTPQVSHQFRGEASEPLRAVQVSLEQIERKFPQPGRPASRAQ